MRCAAACSLRLLRVTGARCESADAQSVPLAVAAVGVWGANTGVGKTLLCAALVAAEARAGRPSLYVKPLQARRRRARTRMP